MVEIEKIRSVLAKSIGIIMSCLCTLLFQTHNAATSYPFTALETVFYNITQVKKSSDKTHAPSSLTTHSYKANNPLWDNHNCIHFIICVASIEI